MRAALRRSAKLARRRAAPGNVVTMFGDPVHYALEGTTAIVTLDDGKANALLLTARPCACLISCVHLERAAFSR